MWKSGFSFSDRMNAILKITASIRSALAETAPAQAQMEARTIEKDIFAQATSQEDRLSITH